MPERGQVNALPLGFKEENIISLFFKSEKVLFQLTDHEQLPHCHNAYAAQHVGRHLRNHGSAQWAAEQGGLVAGVQDGLDL